MRNSQGLSENQAGFSLERAEFSEDFVRERLVLEKFVRKEIARWEFTWHICVELLLTCALLIPEALDGQGAVGRRS
jgi:hypothetical protein